MSFLTAQRNRFKLLVVFLGVAVLAGCGGGASTTTADPANVSPAVSPAPATGPTGSSSNPPPAQSTSSTPASGSAPPAAGVVSIAAHTLKVDVAGVGTSPMTTPAVNTPASGSIILVQVLTQNADDNGRIGTFSSLTDNKGNTYTRIGNAQTYAGVGAGSDLFACINAKGGPGQTWSLYKTPSYEDNEATLFVVVLSGASGLGQVTYSGSRSNDSANPIVTTGPNSLVVSFWGPADFTGSQSNPTNVYNPPAGWTRLDMGNNSLNSNSGADAWQIVPNAGTTVNPMWSAQTAINNPTSSMWLVEVKP